VEFNGDGTHKDTHKLVNGGAVRTRGEKVALLIFTRGFPVTQ